MKKKNQQLKMEHKCHSIKWIQHFRNVHCVDKIQKDITQAHENKKVWKMIKSEMGNVPEIESAWYK